MVTWELPKAPTMLGPAPILVPHKELLIMIVVFSRKIPYSFAPNVQLSTLTLEQLTNAMGGLLFQTNTESLIVALLLLKTYLVTMQL